MTRIAVHIEGENAQEVHEALAGMAGVRAIGAGQFFASDTQQIEDKIAAAIAAANAAPLVPDTAPKATRAKAEPKPAKASEADVFAEQVKTVTKEAAAAEAAPKIDVGEVTFKMVQDALAAYSSKNSMIKAREVLGTFKNAEGGPVARISEVQPADFGDVLAKLSA